MQEGVAALKTHLVEGVRLVAGLLERLEQRKVEAAVVPDVPPHVRQQHDVDKALRLQNTHWTC